MLELFAGLSIPRDFADLRIPLSVVATDFYDCRQIAIRSSDLHQAVAASIAIPVVFKPVTFQDRVMIDGGVVNPLPFDILPSGLDIIIAVDVIGSPVLRKGRRIPSASDSIFGATQILMQTITADKLKTRPPDILIRPDIDGFRVLNFLKADEILRAAEPVKDEVRRKLEGLLEKQGRRVSLRSLETADLK
ncbi:MAG: patatin-like phospholipase family protein [Breoghania sp.]|nr:patatin-like phospholipase family protein [Breoghania sp.]MDJ0930249.1 patatin-like phospholipase family protein [Breoghania sp.]